MAASFRATLSTYSHFSPLNRQPMPFLSIAFPFSAQSTHTTQVPFPCRCSSEMRTSAARSSPSMVARHKVQKSSKSRCNKAIAIATTESFSLQRDSWCHFVDVTLNLDASSSSASQALHASRFSLWIHVCCRRHHQTRPWHGGARACPMSTAMRTWRSRRALCTPSPTLTTII